MSAPLIGLTTRTLTLPRQIRYDRSQAVAEDYVDAIRRAGGLPVLLPSNLGEGLVAAAARLDGYVLTGGPDVDPELFEEEPLAGLGDVDRVRDEAEIELCHDAIARDVPLLAICRGIQVLGVACGGTVIQDLEHAGIPGLLNHDLRSFDDSAGHTVTLKEGTRLHEILGATRLRVNSAHHQAVGEPGELVVSARSADGVIEAVEHPVASFVIGVEWHPERTAAPHGAALLSAFVEACSE